MDMEGQLRRLRKTVEEQGSELARQQRGTRVGNGLTSELGQQSRLMKLFDETLQQTSQQNFTLEHRLSNLEHERETGSRSTRNAFESLGARVTELGVEVAELPTLKEIQATWQQLAQSLESCERILRAEHQEALSCLSSRMEAALGNLQKDASMCHENLNHCRQDVTSLQRQIWEDDSPVQTTPPPPKVAPLVQLAPSEPVTATASAGAPVKAPITLVKRLKEAEDKLSCLDDRGKVEREGLLHQLQLKAHVRADLDEANQKDFEDLQKVVAGKSEKGHTHDCLLAGGLLSHFSGVSTLKTLRPANVKRTVPPVTLRRTSCGTHAPHSFDLCHLLDDSILPEELNNSVLPRQAFGAFRCEECLTYEFSVRVSDGYRWSEWSPPSARCCFAVEPKIVTTCPVELDELQRALTDVPDVVSPAESVELSKALTEQLTFTQEGDMEPPHWVAIARPPSSSDVVTATAQLSEFLVSWPNLPPSAYSQPDTEILPAVKQMSETGDLAPFLAPPLVYRIN
ncbi:unnamed protein product, partial [Cladocopium goreaui]